MKKRFIFPILLLCAVTLFSCAKDHEKPSETQTHPSTQSPTQEHTEDPTDDPTHTKIMQILQNMTLEEKVGQMFIARCPDADAVGKVSQYALSGYILFGRDFKDKTPSDVTTDIAAYQDAANIPLFIAVDEEGGTVVRVSKYEQFRSKPFPSPQKAWNNGGAENVRKDTLEKCELLLSLGININLAPVCDVSTDKDDYIYPRTLGKDAATTAEFIKTVVETMRGTGVGCALKHFPGYGNNKNTHTGISVDTRPYETFRTSDFLPFKAGIDSGAGIVMVSHNIVSCMDADKPASLSAAVHDILRGELGFDGVIMTDDLYMDAIRDYTDAKAAAVDAVLAGNDLICCTDFEIQVPAVIEAVKNGDISLEAVEAAVTRILALKAYLGIIK